MPLIKTLPKASSRMAMAWVLGSVEKLAVLEFGQMGHTIYQEKIMMLSMAKKRGKYISTHIDEKDLALGLSNKLEEAIINIEKMDIDAVAILPSSTGEIIGTDLEAILEEMETEFRFPVFLLEKGGFQYNFETGIEEAFYKLISNISKQSTIEENTFSIIGGYYALSNEDIINQQNEILEANKDKKLIANMNLNVSVEDIENIGKSEVVYVIGNCKRVSEYLENIGVKVVQWKK